MVLPGSYRIRLRVGTTTQEQPLVVTPDPRGRADQALLAEQFRFLKQLRDTVHAVTTAIITMRNARAQLEDDLPRLSGAAATRARQLITSLATIEDSLYQRRNMDVEDDLLYPPRVTERISSLFGMAESSDGKPPQQVYDVFALFAPKIQALLTAYRAALRDG